MTRRSRFALSLVFILAAVAAVVYHIRTKATVQVATAPVTDGPMTRRIVAHEHPKWSESDLERETARRMSHGAV